MSEASMIGLDLAKNFIQAHGVDGAGKVLFRKKLRRSELMPFLAAQPPCVVAMEACSGAHHVGREAMKLGHTPRLVPPSTAFLALAPPPETFRRGRDFAAWVGLTPLQRSTGGRDKIGKTSKRGERTLRRLLMLGAAGRVRHALRGGAGDPWLERMLARKPRALVITALANKMARTVWAVAAHGQTYRAPAAAA